MPLYVQNGKLLNKNGTLSTSAGCCCGNSSPCQRCINIYRARYQNDTKYCAREDVYELEVNIPAAYSFPLTVRITGGVDDDLKINGTLIEDNVYEFQNEGCNGAHCVGGGSAGYPITISSSPMTLTLVDNFGQGRTLDITVCLDPDNEQNVNECPTVTEVSSVGYGWTSHTDACCVDPICPTDTCRCSPPTACNCSGAVPIGIPESITLEFTLGTLVDSLGSCTHAQAASLTEGTYVCAFWFSTSLAAYYRVILSNGVIVGVTWYCGTGNFGQSLDWDIFYCGDESDECFCQFWQYEFYFGPPGSAFTSKVKSLCDLTTGDTTPLDYTGDGILRMDQRHQANCCGTLSPLFRSYLVLATLTPSW